MINLAFFGLGMIAGGTVTIIFLLVALRYSLPLGLEGFEQ